MQAWDNKTYANIANASLKHTHDAFVNLASTSEYIVGSLPYLSPQQQQQWWFLKSKVDGILQETAAADASVSAVAKVTFFHQFHKMQSSFSYLLYTCSDMVAAIEILTKLFIKLNRTKQMAF